MTQIHKMSDTELTEFLNHNHTQIHEFVEGMSDSSLTELFKHYHRGCYDHLLGKKRIPVTKSEERQALKKYFHCIMIEAKNEEDSERWDILSPYMKSNNEMGLVNTIIDDQFYEEPLVHIINGCTPWGAWKE